MQHGISLTIEQVGAPHIRFSVEIDNPTDPRWKACLRSGIVGVGRLLHLAIVDGDLKGSTAIGVVSEDGTHIIGRSPFSLA
jgi:hypothetical protein